ncbi:pyridoxal phosphate-dependent aminotransferase [Arthrobacter bambusae]|jgi:alanine-synthesizing transaminase|uniref:pyridoxal phosphate-dependent aminotransferase n=1 Tax=Arthrobacter TaxID=1663 RepID=UPI0009913248|nr:MULTISPECIES: pyridoxal phosphate-dependent aminotransferase [Arthrobacter]MCI0142439.1 pyridoxal phosphate-dependent aminotransferase [Arthrobacter bambusae]MDQ0210639.1 alanine-synthesizing transaminase [Arthrobacter bambusae]MDQ0235311.1 alanine-synthesizing transaminase [Arthrobacter bambusae]OOP61671.1 aminotransferase [Arthrobacter sp. SRS-W-1-2016]UYY81188.1 pyridoxal phosphate-dependent aminotransferase [Arthrobacter sp. YA7-1]
MRPMQHSSKLQNVRYELRGPILQAAKTMEAEGHRILKMNLGDTAPFGLEAPESVVVDMIHHLRGAQGYSDSKGIFTARTAISQYYQTKNLMNIGVEDIFIGNGVSELISMTLQAFLENGDEVLIPAPDYPLWTATVTLTGGTPVHYLCDEGRNWWPDMSDVEAKITKRTKAIVIINPNNPTGAVYPRHILEEFAALARKHDLVLFSDEIYEKIRYEDAQHIHTASVADDICVLTFSGLSKAYRMPGYRAGWVAVTGPHAATAEYREALELLASLRLCSNVPAQHAIQTCLGGYQSIEELIRPGGRLREQRDLALKLLTAIPGVSCVPAAGAMYLFPRLDLDVYPIESDEKFVLDLLQDQKILVSHGSAFNWPAPDHFRFVILPSVREIEEAVRRIATFLAAYRNRPQA